jgi:hypothetical protein
LRRQPDFVAGAVLPPRLQHPTAADFNSLRRHLNEPQLGLATTRQLLQELSARGRVGKLDPKNATSNIHLETEADHLLQLLAPEVLDYRTVDE